MTPRADYGGHVPAVSGGGTIGAIAPGSPAERSGLRPGDVVTEVDGQPLRDVIDWQWLTDDDSATLAVVRHGCDADRFELTRANGETWGLSFTETVFDGVRTCRNRCSFCFMAQLPKGLRRALYLRDDDYRLSFLQGNFVTLTNLSDEDVDRIIEQNLSPLYVSLHAVDPRVRQELICAREDRALERLDSLLRGRHRRAHPDRARSGSQRREQLERSLTWLAEREGIVSVGIVPLGYTAHQERFPGSYESPSAAAAVIAQIEPWQRAFRQRDDVTWVHLADEFYLNARAQVPAAEFYDGFPQYENGIGLVRDWLDGVAVTPRSVGLGRVRSSPCRSLWRAEPSSRLSSRKRSLRSATSPQNGFTFSPSKTGSSAAMSGSAGCYAPKTCSRRSQATPPGTVVLVPDILVNADGLLLDDVPAAELGMRSGREVRLVSCDAAGLLGGLHEAAADPHGMKE